MSITITCITNLFPWPNRGWLHQLLCREWRSTGQQKGRQFTRCSRWLACGVRKRQRRSAFWCRAGSGHDLRLLHQRCSWCQGNQECSWYVGWTNWYTFFYFCIHTISFTRHMSDMTTVICTYKYTIAMDFIYFTMLIYILSSLSVNEINKGSLTRNICIQS